MSGTVSGGRKAAKTNMERYGKDYYAKMGKKGGENSRNGGFACKKKGKDGLTGPERAKKVGQIGGLISRRGPAKEGTKKPTKKPVKKTAPKRNPLVDTKSVRPKEEKKGLLKRLFRSK